MSKRAQIIIAILGAAMIVVAVGAMALMYFGGPHWLRILANCAGIALGIGMLINSVRMYRARRR